MDINAEIQEVLDAMAYYEDLASGLCDAEHRADMTDIDAKLQALGDELDALQRLRDNN